MSNTATTCIYRLTIKELFRYFVQFKLTYDTVINKSKFTLNKQLLNLIIAKKKVLSTALLKNPYDRSNCSHFILPQSPNEFSHVYIFISNIIIIIIKYS